MHGKSAPGASSLIAVQFVCDSEKERVNTENLCTYLTAKWSDGF